MRIDKMIRHFLLTIMAALAALTVSAQSDRISIEDFVLDRDSTISVSVMLINETPVRGLQFSITMPEGIEITEHSLTKSSKKYGMNLVFRQVDNDDYAVFIYPMDHVCYPSDSVAILTLELTAAADFKGGEIILSGVRGSTIDNKSFSLDGDTATVTVPASSLIGIPVDQTQDKKKFF